MGVMRGLAAALLVPPVSLMIVALFGGLLGLRGGRAGAVLAMLASAALLLLATPIVSTLLLHSLEGSAAAATAPAPGAIVVLGGDGRAGPGGADLGPLSLERVRRAAAVQRASGLPLLVTAGPVMPDQPPLAEAMRRCLEEEFGIPVRWVEHASRNTGENASLSAPLLQAEGIHTVILVTHAWHMKRAQAAFGRHGIATRPAPVGEDSMRAGRASDWLPRADHLAMSWYALREWAGIAAAAAGY